MNDLDKIREKTKVKRYFDILYPERDFKYKVKRHLIDDNPYKDLDGIQNEGYKYSCKEFYEDLCKYLSERACKDNMNVSFSMEDNLPGIICRKKDGDIMYPLKSDQLAFSFNGVASKCKKYPYGNLYNKVKGKDIAKENFEFIAECLYDTRTLGASFLWPMVCDKNGAWVTNPDYNRDRGIRNYIEDRVDLTLWEIKECYEWLPPKHNENKAVYDGKNILIKEVEKNCNMEDWIRLFGSFEQYVDFFSFNPYVIDIDGEYIPINIVTSVVSENIIKTVTPDYVEKLRENNEKAIQRLGKEEDIKRVLENVRLLTLSRSRLME